jgi:lipopolysaccharide/colanic/teichoic acid biosynthesis glycosyltransferase
MTRILDNLPGLKLLRGDRTFESVHSAGRFAVILNRERDRADRTGREFSLVAFDVPTDHRKFAAARTLLQILVRGIRSTDDIGWLRDGRVAAALSHTGTDAAWKFVDKIRYEYRGNPPAPECAVYTYPSSWITRGDEDEDPAEKTRREEAFRSMQGLVSEGMQSSDETAANPARPVEEVQSSFLCRIPLWKRVFDIAVSLMALIFLSPFFLIYAVYLRIVSPGPVFFRQDRVGYLGRRFTIWKFRTMHVNADTSVHRNHLKNLIDNEQVMAKLDDGKDSRIIPYGYLIRAAGIDELPQLINVLRGEMSLIGPRPCLPYEAREYTAWQLRRFDTLPGLTGLWQVSGKNRTTFKEMMRLDIAYARKRALVLDAMIFLKTVPAILRQVMDRPSLAPIRAKWDAVVLRAIPMTLILSLMQARRK